MTATVDAGRTAVRGRTSVPFLMSAPALVLMTLFLVLPTISVVITSFTTSPSVPGDSTDHYREILSDSYYRGVLLDTARTSVVATVVTLLVGYPISLYLVFSTDRLKRYVVLLILSPLFISVVVRAYSLALLLGRTSPLNLVLPEPLQLDLVFTQTAVIIGLTYTLLPYMVLSVSASLAGVDRRTLAAARGLGAGFGYTLRTILIPLSIPGIVSGCVIVCTLAMSSVALPLILGGSGYQMWVYLIYQQILIVFDWPTGFSMAMVLFVAILVLLAVGRLAVRAGSRRSR